MRAAAFALAAAVTGTLALAACAPRMQNTHYERWAGQDAKRRADRAAEEKAAATAPGKGPPAAAPKVTPPVAPKPVAPPPPPGDDYDSFSETPPVRTATKSRAVQPADDEAIY
jgi:hypothetical protein